VQSEQLQGVGESVDPMISKNRVHFRIFSFELTRASLEHRLNEQDKDELLKVAKDILEDNSKPDTATNMNLARSMTAAEFIQKLEASQTSDRFKSVIDAIKKAPHFK
jgi:hypothetical protein